MRILVVEDEKPLAFTLKTLLTKQFCVDVAHSGREGEELVTANEYDTLVLDINLPDISGIELCQNLRQDQVQIPILMLTGLKTVEDTVRALDAGADDYLIKPFQTAELLARIRALLRRNRATLGGNIQSTLSVADLQLCTTTQTATRGETPIRLRKKEFQLLEYLVRFKGQAIPREKLLEHIWEDHDKTYTNTVDVHIKHLRDKVDRPFNKKLIKTVHCQGYKVEE